MLERMLCEGSWCPHQPYVHGQSDKSEFQGSVSGGLSTNIIMEKSCADGNQLMGSILLYVTGASGNSSTHHIHPQI